MGFEVDNDGVLPSIVKAWHTGESSAAVIRAIDGPALLFHSVDGFITWGRSGSARRTSCAGADSEHSSRVRPREHVPSHRPGARGAGRGSATAGQAVTFSWSGLPTPVVIKL